MIARQTFVAWLVHGYTALGGVAGMCALLAAAAGDIRRAFLYLGVAGVSDATDGVLARRARVHEVLPNFSGAQLDNAIDILTFVWIPIFILGAEELLPHPVWLGIPILAALYAYGQVNMKTRDHFFLGFPSYWNVVALYMWWLRPGPVAAVLMVLAPGVLSFIPTRYLYPSRNRLLWKTTLALGLLWAGLVVWLLVAEQPPEPRLVALSLCFPLYYLVLSFFLDFRIRCGKRG